MSRFEPGTTWLRQVHGAAVVRVRQPGEHAGAEADAAWTDVPGAKLAVRTADCVPIVLSRETETETAAVAVVHAGWRGLAAGIVAATVEAMGGATAARVGPHIRAGCYEFGADGLDVVAAALGDGVRSTTTWGTPALDLAAAARAALGAITTIDDGACTACSDRYFSWRRHQHAERFATIAWLEP